MVEVGKTNTLEVSRNSDFGLLFDGGELGEILMPKRYVSKDWKPGDSVDVFVMLDSEDRLTATTLRPKAQVGEFALLRAVDVTDIGAFLDWGMPKDLFVPFREQRVKMRQGESYIVHIYFDRASGRIAASSKLDKYLESSKRFYKNGEEVDLMIWQKTDLGYKAIINNERWGMVFHNEIFQAMQRGARIKGFIKQVRPDGRIDLCLHKPGYEKVTDLTDRILNHIKGQGGFMPVTDKSPPEEIYGLFGVSKKTYKKAIGALYKKRLITFEEGGTRLV
ncbi:MAG: S1-like domain-containing RNA-binding protein [Verrucomicrobiota bacterium]|nr:S1-like domain-containing RNA-binding protein [Verrucomicrobiota bacterium]